MIKFSNKTDWVKKEPYQYISFKKLFKQSSEMLKIKKYSKKDKLHTKKGKAILISDKMKIKVIITKQGKNIQ